MSPPMPIFTLISSPRQGLHPPLPLFTHKKEGTTLCSCSSWFCYQDEDHALLCLCHLNFDTRGMLHTSSNLLYLYFIIHPSPTSFTLILTCKPPPTPAFTFSLCPFRSQASGVTLSSLFTCFDDRRRLGQNLNTTKMRLCWTT